MSRRYNPIIPVGIIAICALLAVLILVFHEKYDQNIITEWLPDSIGVVGTVADTAIVIVRPGKSRMTTTSREDTTIYRP